MRIIEMTATFGRLNKVVLRPGAGLTLIEAPNESGKSTWAAFLRAMLYGFPTRDRNSAGYLAEKNRYQPWSGAAMEGSIRLEWKGREVTLYRGPKGSVPWGAFSALWSATNEPVEGMTGENCGELLLGVSREVFERTAFVGQNGAFLSPSADLEKRIAALATSGEEEVSFSQVERRLKDWLNRRRVNSRVGLIPELTEQLSQVDAALERQGSILCQAQQSRQESEALDARRLELEARLQAHAASEKAQQAQRRREAQADYDALSAQSEAQRRAVEVLPSADILRQAQGDLTYLNTLAANERLAEKAIPEAQEKAHAAEAAIQADPYFAGMDPDQAAAQAQRDYDAAHQAGEKARKVFRPGFLLSLPFLLTAIMALYAYIAIGDTTPFAPWWGFLVLYAPWIWGGWGAAVLGLFLWQKKLKSDHSKLLQRYDAQAPEDILSKAAAYRDKRAAAQESQRELQTIERERDKLSAQREELTEQLLSLVRPFAPDVTDLFGLSAALSRALQQGENYRLLQARTQAAEQLLAALPQVDAVPAPLSSVPLQGDPDQLSGQLAAVRGELRRVSDAASRLQGELNSLGDPAELEAQRSSLLEELEKRQGEYDAISAALDGLKAADDALRARFSPAVNQKAGEYLSALTGGRYGKAALTRQFQALAQEPGDVSLRQDLSLSAGAAQQLYLALRLAMCELALPQTEPCPLVLDDVLDTFDDQRAKLALNCLLDMAKNRQVLLFTCHSREGELLRGTGAAVAAL